jgi:hypothetical protein
MFTDMAASSRQLQGTDERRREYALDEALSATFPASDPVAVGRATATEAPGAPVDRRAPLIDLDDVRAAGRRQRRRPSTK